jgi:ATP-binding cassette subfamily F protein 3
VEFGATRIFDDVTFTVGRGERWGIVGRNGTGKTTLLNVIAGRLVPTRGTVTRTGNPRFTLLDQHREYTPATSVRDVAALPFAELIALEHALERQAVEIGAAGAAATPAALARYDHDLERFARLGGYEVDARVDAVLQGLGFDPADARTRTVDTLSGGELGRVALARQLVDPANVLLLDEPTNHLDLETTAWLEDYLLGLDATMLVISHDRVFLERVVDHVLHFEGGTAVPYTGGYSAFVTQRAERRLALERAVEQQQRFIAAEEDYIRRNIAGQNTKQAKGRRTRLARLPRLSPPPTERGAMGLRLESASRGGDQVLVAENARLAVGRRTLLDGFTGRIERGDVVGLIGPNGAGKSTLLEAIAGEREIDGGTLRIGSSITLAYYRQDLAQVPMGQSLFGIIHDLRPQWDRGQVQSHLGRFGFSGDEVQRQADTLSGGERARVALAMLVLVRANFLLLDEPTNHLDVESIEALEDAVVQFDGTVLLVSHDRGLLRALVTRVWSLAGGRVTDYPGSFEEWEQAQRDLAAAAGRAAGERAAQERERGRAEARRRQQDARQTQAASRARREKLQKAEAAVHALEARIAALEAGLHDPSLYAGAEGARRASEMQAELETARTALDLAMGEWLGLVE